MPTEGNYRFDREQAKANLQSLTARERTVLYLICQGASREEIAKELVLRGVGGVDFHLNNIASKLELPPKGHPRYHMLYRLYCQILEEEMEAPSAYKVKQPKVTTKPVQEPREEDASHIRGGPDLSNKPPQESPKDTGGHPPSPAPRLKLSVRQWLYGSAILGIFLCICLALAVFALLTVAPNSWRPSLVAQSATRTSTAAIPTTTINVPTSTPLLPTSTPLVLTSTPLLPTATRTLVPPTATSTPDLRLFWDDFENGIKPQWHMAGNNYGTVNGQLSSVGWFTAYVGDTNWANYAVEFDLPYLIWSGYDFRILVRRQSDTDYMSWQLLTVNRCSFRWVIVQRGQEKVVVKSETELEGWPSCLGHFRIEASGNTYKTYSAGQLRLVFTNNELRRGNVGIVSTGKGETAFTLDNFVVWQLP